MGEQGPGTAVRGQLASYCIEPHSSEPCHAFRRDKVPQRQLRWEGGAFPAQANATLVDTRKGHHPGEPTLTRDEGGYSAAWTRRASHARSTKRRLRKRVYYETTSRNDQAQPRRMAEAQHSASVESRSRQQPPTHPFNRHMAAPTLRAASRTRTSPHHRWLGLRPRQCAPGSRPRYSLRLGAQAPPPISLTLQQPSGTSRPPSSSPQLPRASARGPRDPHSAAVGILASLLVRDLLLPCHSWCIVGPSNKIIVP